MINRQNFSLNKLLSEISVIEAKAYLLSKGWNVTDQLGEKALILSSPNSFRDAMLPLDEAFSDYTSRMSELVFLLSDTENRELDVITKEIKLSGFDVFKVRLLDSHKDGTLPINVTPNIIEKAREMLASTASSLFSPSRRVYGSRRTKEVEGYLQKVRLGQTEIGSYIFTLLSPVSPSISKTLPLFEESFIETDDPVERSITKNLDYSIIAAHKAAKHAIINDNLDAFEQGIASHLSANFCEALSSITKEAGSTEFSVSWGSVRPYNFSPKNEQEHPKFTVQLAGVLEEAAKRFRSIEPIPDYTLNGYIYSLDKDKNDPQGNVQMKANIDGTLKTVKLGLSDRDYAIAMIAHDGYKPVTVTGELIQRGKNRVLYGIKNFRIIADEN